MRWLFACAWLVCGGLFACGDSKRAPNELDAPMVDAQPDAPIGFPCMKSSECNGNACCLHCGPGGACFTVCSDDNTCPTYDFALCDPNEPCTTRAGTAGTCREEAHGFGGATFWVCGM
jgi:hypothetical protein